jgi:hypothetical protein
VSNRFKTAFLDSVILWQVMKVVLPDVPQHFHPFLLLLGAKDAALRELRMPRFWMCS